jgi:hypothetical protein
MNAVKILCALILTAFIVACNSSGGDGVKYIGTWHTAPVDGKYITRQNFLEITNINDNHFRAARYWIDDTSTGAKQSGTGVAIYAMEKGILVGPLNATITADSQGVLHTVDGMEFRK